MNPRMCVVAAAVLGVPVATMAGTPAGPAQNGERAGAARQPGSSGVTVEAARPVDGTRIVWHTDRPPADARDARVDFGQGWKISMPGTTPGWPQWQGGDHAIAMPDNTMGPGVPLWLMRDRENADRKVAEAVAAYAQREAERAHPAHDAFGYGSGLYFVPGAGSAWRWIGLHGPVAAGVVHDDLLGATARRRFADDARPRIGPDQEARDRAVQRFGRDATPPVRRVEEERERAWRDAQKEKAPEPRPAQPPRPPEPPK